MDYVKDEITFHLLRSSFKISLGKELVKMADNYSDFLKIACAAFIGQGKEDDAKK